MTNPFTTFDPPLSGPPVLVSAQRWLPPADSASSNCRYPRPGFQAR